MPARISPRTESGPRLPPATPSGPVLLVRPDGNDEDAAALAEVGVPTLVEPYLTWLPDPDPEPARELLDVLRCAADEPPTWLLLTSPRTYRGWAALVGADRLGDALRAACDRGLRLGAVGAATAATVPGLAGAVVLAPTPSAAGLLDRLRNELPGTALLPVSRRAAATLPDGLRELGWQVHVTPVYDIVTVAERPASADLVDTGQVSGVLLRSPSAVRALAAHAHPGPRTTVFAVGPSTSAEAARHPWHVVSLAVGPPGTVARDVAAALGDGSPTSAAGGRAGSHRTAAERRVRP